MSTESIGQLTTAFKTDVLVANFVALAPWIMGVVGLLVVMGLLSWGIYKTRRRLSGGMG